MYHVVAATTNPAKIKAITLAFDDVFGNGNYHIEGLEVDSGVPEQPIGNTETRTGARHRVMCARQVRPEADFWVGIEAGLEDNMTFAWMTVENHRLRGESRSASLMLPERILQEIHAGRALGEEMVKLTGIEGVNRREGAIGIFTQGKLTRTSVYHQALVLALVPFHNEIYNTHPAPSSTPEE
ncbi:inosine/xanthosine triphosphatase [Enterobacillus tribolii]|uniref:Inosine/xanthosine triphosphatase n=1 Tax=Enterobacillus tribolii TaxID=1487935 RepID=A0A370QQ28_9GAMM|nr:inosine/xanthosine triphosphatase [Enterobacillus tribolii]MBW7981529.1 non-canonical purine NTP phosphatase [Enterobacillus tribolii]RDK90906.1 inosine/xanthosine triphosphatase [Enterobacillus tribolii]